jgi:hypothetical protein
MVDCLKQSGPTSRSSDSDAVLQVDVPNSFFFGPCWSLDVVMIHVGLEARVLARVYVLRPDLLLLAANVSRSSTNGRSLSPPNKQANHAVYYA